jgi:adenine-specific DNA-methyltransferase
VDANRLKPLAKKRSPGLCVWKRRVKTEISGKGQKGGAAQYEAEPVGLDVFDPVEMKSDHWPGDDVPAWFLDTDYNGLCFHVSQAFFSRTSAWDSLKKALRGTYDDAVRHHERSVRGRATTARSRSKVVEDRGNELMVVKDLNEAR